jgi:hypothetical protein
VTEREWQRQITDLATMLGWSWYHTHDSRRSPAGFPDLVLWRERVVYVELKAQRGRLRPEQRVTITAFRQAGAEVYVWRPSDFDTARRVLTVLRPARRPEGVSA